jgi:hypothetical protein
MLPSLALVSFIRLESLLAVMLGHDMGPDKFQRLLSSALRNRLRVVMDPEKGRTTLRCIPLLPRFADFGCSRFSRALTAWIAGNWRYGMGRVVRLGGYRRWRRMTGPGRRQRGGRRR